MHRSLGFIIALLAILFCPLAALLCPHTARAADLETLVQQLGADDFDAKADAIKALGVLGDSRAIVPLRALSDGMLYTAEGGKVVIAEENGETAATFDPITHAALGDVKTETIDKITVNNRLRSAIAEALGSLTLFSDKRDERLSAAHEALKNATPEGVPALKKALDHETDGDVRQALLLAIAASQLGSANKDEQLAAIAAMAKSSDPQIYGLLREYRGNKDLSPEARTALVSAINGIERRQQLIGIVQNLFEGLSLGSVLLLAAIGLAITFGVMGVINMAHGEMIMLGAYTTYVVQEIFVTALPPGWLDAYLVVAVPIAFLVAGAAGIVIERGVIRFLYGRPLETMLATWGVSLILQQLVRSIFGAPNKAVANPSWMTGGFELIGGGIITWNRVVILVFCFVVLGVLALVLRRTSFGLHMRAVTQNRGMAAAMGIPTSRVDALTFGLGSGIAGIAGVALSQIGNVSPNLGQIYIVDSFLVVVFGGVGNLAGTLVGAMTLGIVNKILEPVAGAVLGKIVVLLAIILFIQKRPRGLFALKGRAAEG
jgi:urea transport system permease protein